MSARQDRLLRELHEATGSIERLPKEEHGLIREVRPDVEEIKETVGRVGDKR